MAGIENIFDFGHNVTGRQLWRSARRYRFPFVLFFCLSFYLFTTTLRKHQELLQGKNQRVIEEERERGMSRLVLNEVSAAVWGEQQEQCSNHGGVAGL